VNETTNRYWAAMGDKQDWYNMLMTQLPRVKFKKLQYIKKPKETNNKDDELIKRLADNMEISQREVRLLLEKQSIDKKMFNVDIYKK
jgi:hypothetical protein